MLSCLIESSLTESIFTKDPAEESFREIESLVTRTLLFLVESLLKGIDLLLVESVSVTGLPKISCGSGMVFSAFFFEAEST